MTSRLYELESRANTALNDTDLIDALNALGEYLSEVDTKRANSIGEQARVLALRAGYQRGLIGGLLNQARVSFTTSDYTLSVKTTMQALKLAREHAEKIYELDALTILGSNHNVVGNRTAALECYLKALAISEQINQPIKIASILNNIGQHYLTAGDLKQALEHFRHAAKLYMEHHTTGIQPGISLLNMAETYNRVGDYNRALRCAGESLKVFQNEQYIIGQTYALVHTGTACYKLGKPAEAHQYFQQALDLIQTTDTQFHEGAVERVIASALIEQNKPQHAIPYLEHALEIFETLHTKPEIYATHDLFARVYQSLGDYRTAYEHLEKFHHIKEEVFNEQADSRQKTLQAIYEVERARLEAETQHHRNAALEVEIQQNAQLIAELDSYADSVAHDLKNPIGVIVAYARLLEMNLAETLDEESRTYLDNMLAAADKMDEIVEALLSLARARKQEILPQHVDMTFVIYSAMQRVQPQIEESAAVIEVQDQLPAVMGHESWLEEVWANYLTNAIKYGGQPPHVYIGATPEGGGFIRYWIRDNGKGLTEEQQARLFNKFERLGHHKIDGYGLGLALVKTIIEKLGGQVGVMSTGVPGEGSVFSFTLREQQPDSVAAP